MRFSLLTAPLVLAVSLGVSAQVAGAQPERKVSFRAANLSFQEAVAKLCQETGISCDVDPQIPDHPSSFEFQNVTPSFVLQKMVDLLAAGCMGVDLRRQGDRYAVSILLLEEQKKQRVLTQPVDPRLSRKVRMDLKQVPLRKAAGDLFEGSDARIVVAEGVPDVAVSVNLQQVTAFDALRRVADVAAWQVPELELTREKGVYRLELAARAPADPAVKDLLKNRTVTVHLQDAPLSMAVRQVFRGSGVQYRIHRNVPRARVTLDLQDVTLEAALQRLIQKIGDEAPGLGFGFDGSILIMETRGPGAAARNPNAI